ncbi:MAG: DMT family transporter [Rhodospirillales bacterium]|nr:DMT family transporter [Rhodospirillales bacterium]
MSRKASPERASHAARPAHSGGHALAPLAALALLTVIWGLSVPMMKLGLRDIPAAGLVTLRYLAAAPCFAVMLAGRPLPHRRNLAAMAALGLFGIDAGQFSQMLGVQLTSAAVATMITAIIPVLTVLLASLRLRQQIRPPHIVGFALALGGIAIAISAPAGTLPVSAAAVSSARALGGEALVLLSAFCIAGYYVLSVEVAAREGVIVTAAWSSIIAAAGLLPVAFFTVPASEIHLTPRAIFVVLYLGLAVTVLGIWIWLHALSRLPARIAGASQYGQPLVGIAAAALLFGDRLDLRFLTGTALVLAGIGFSAVPGRGTGRTRA